MEKEMTAHSIILAGEFHGQRSLVGYSPWTHKESDVAEQLTHTTLYIETKNSRLDKTRWQSNKFQMKEEDKTPEKQQVNISNLPEKEFKLMVVRWSKNSGEEWMNRVRS